MSCLYWLHELRVINLYSSSDHCTICIWQCDCDHVWEVTVHQCIEREDWEASCGAGTGLHCFWCFWWILAWAWSRGRRTPLLYWRWEGELRLLFIVLVFKTVYSRFGIFHFSGQHSFIEHVQVSNCWMCCSLLRDWEPWGWTCEMGTAGLQRRIRAVEGHKERDWAPSQVTWTESSPTSGISPCFSYSQQEGIHWISHLMIVTKHNIHNKRSLKYYWILCRHKCAFFNKSCEAPKSIF